MKIENCKLKIVWERLLDILMPRRCMGCGKEGQYICNDCSLFLSEASPQESGELGEVRPLQAVMSVWEYEGIVEKAILKIKYDGCFDIVGGLVDKAFEKIELNLPKDTVITYVPMYRKRERERGFNQAKLIAERIGEKTGRPVAKLLEKIKDNRTQVGLNPQERQENVKGAFACLERLDLSKQKSVLLVDDVYTTGATAKECVRILRKAGVKNVRVFTLARKLSL